MSDDNEKLNKESQLNVGIYAIRVSLYNNLGKPVDLNSKMFVFPDGSSLTSELNNNPYLSSNIKYNTKKLDKMTHPECIQTFFNKRAFINFLRDEQIIDYESQPDQDENGTVRENVETMLEYMFPMSFPVIKVVKRKSAPMALGFIKAFKKEFFKKKYNTFLNIGGKTNTVDGVTILDTFSTNPVYIKAYEIIQKYKQQIIPVLNELFDRLNVLHEEFSIVVNELDKKTETEAKKEAENLKENLKENPKENPKEEVKESKAKKGKATEKTNPDNLFAEIKSKYFGDGFNLTKSVKEMDDKMKEIKKSQLTQNNFGEKFKPISEALKLYSEYLDEMVKNNMFENKKLKEEDNIKTHNRLFHDSYVKLYKLTNIKKLINICYFLTLMPYIETYRDNLSNYDINAIADLKKYGFHKKTIEDFTQYYFPKRMTLNKETQLLFNTTNLGNEIDIVGIEKMFNDKTNQKIRIDVVDVDKIELNNEDRNNPRYNIQVQISIFGGMVSDAIKKFIKCIYEERKIGADITRYIINSEQSEYFDLTSEIAKIEKRMAATQKGKNNKPDKAKVPIQKTDGKRDYVNANPVNVNPVNVNPVNVNPVNVNPVGENTKQKNEKSLKITDTHEIVIDTLFRESVKEKKDKFDKKKEDADKTNNPLDEKSISYVHVKQAANITIDDLMKEIRSDPTIVKYINLSLNETNDMTNLTVAKEEGSLFDQVDIILKGKLAVENNNREYENDPIKKDIQEKKYTIYYYLIEVIKKIHAKQQEKKYLYREKAKPGGKKTRRKSRNLRKTRKH